MIEIFMVFFQWFFKLKIILYFEQQDGTKMARNNV